LEDIPTDDEFDMETTDPWTQEQYFDLHHNDYEAAVLNDDDTQEKSVKSFDVSNKKLIEKGEVSTEPKEDSKATVMKLSQ
jgi:hypothetical protein